MNRTPMSQSYVNSQAGQQQQQQQQAASSSSQSSQLAASQQQQLQSSTATNDDQSANQAQVGSQMQQLMCATELTNLLLEFAFSVFVNKPADVVEYAANYFNQLHKQQLQQQQQQQQPLSDSKRASCDSQRSSASAVSCNQRAFNASNNNNALINSSQTNIINNSNNSNSNSDFHDDDSMDDSSEFEARRQVNFNAQVSLSRRKSVFAEQYDPAADNEDDENTKVVHSKTDEQRQRLAKAIQSIFIFRSVDPQDTTDILDAMFEVKVKAGDVVIRQGDDGDNFYVVERGKFQIYVERDDGSRDVRGECEHCGSFGELALMYNQPRAATVVALSDGALWAMDRNTFRKIVLKRAYKKRKNYEALFEKVTVLQNLNGYERMNLCDALVSQRFAHGQTIIEQGDSANGMYFIESGQVKIVKRLENDGGKLLELAVLGKGDYFGELALIEHKPRAASVYAVGDEVKLAFLDVKAFERLLGSCIDRMEKNCALYFSELAHNEGRQNV